MDDSGRISILLVGESPQLFYLYQKHLTRKNFECEFAECEQELWEALGRRQFDLVLSLHTGQSTRSPSLVELLRGSPTTLFYGHCDVELIACARPLSPSSEGSYERR